MDTPFQWTKQVASHWGGTRNGTIVHWPNGIAEQGGLRSQFTHVIDLAPTILEAAGLPEPTAVNGVQQSPMEGTSMLYTFNDAPAPERHDLQYFEMFGNRGIYHRGWSAVTKHKTPWVMVGGTMPRVRRRRWELYDGSQDYSQATNLAKDQPERLAHLQRLWLIEAVKYNVLPLDDRSAERLEPSMAGRPTLIRGNSQIFFPGMGRLSENSVVSIKNKSFSVTAEVDVADGGAEGVIIAQGGRFGGWTFYARNGRAKFVYNTLGIQEYAIGGRRADPGRQPPGADGVRLRRWGPGEGRQRHPVLRRQTRWAAVGSRRPNRWSSRPTRRPTSARRPAPP